MQSVTILGASGSIGTAAIHFLRLHRDKFALKNIAVKKDWRRALEICREFDCTAVSLEDQSAATEYKKHASETRTRLLSGPKGAAELAAERVDVVLAAISGSDGLLPVLSAIRAGNRIALANKEALVCGGRELISLASKKGVEIIPVDSEHSAIFQSLLAGRRSEVSSLLLTASGGPFRKASYENMRRATKAEALAHPNWSMGQKNTIDSATLANKGLELIEACYLFNCEEHDVEVVINPSSILHSAVNFRDGSMIAQIGRPDMRVAVGYGLSWPERLTTGVQNISLTALASLEFESIDESKFRCVNLARQALRTGRDGPLIFNAANEVAVAAFLNGQLRLTDIAAIIEICLERGDGRFCGSLDDLGDLTVAALDFSRAVLRTFLTTSD